MLTPDKTDVNNRCNGHLIFIYFPILQQHVPG